MKKVKDKMDIVFLLDRSGSMSGFESDTIGGYNSYIKNNRNKNAFITTILFDDKYEIINNRVKINDVSMLDNKSYFVRGSTALMDAIGKTIKLIEKSDSDKVLFFITTDGYENASKEYNKNQIKELILGHNNWEFIYVSADIDAFEEGSKIGINENNISNYVKSEKGVSKMFNSLSKVTDMYEKESTISKSWKNELEDYINNN